MTHLNCSRLPLTWALVLLYQLPIRFRDLSNASNTRNVMTQKGRLSKLNLRFSQTQVNNHSPNSAVDENMHLAGFGPGLLFRGSREYARVPLRNKRSLSQLRHLPWERSASFCAQTNSSYQVCLYTD